MDAEVVVRKYALQNAVFYDGKATVGAVMGKVMAQNPAMRSRAKEIASVAKRIVDDVNSLSPEEQRRFLEEIAPELLVKESRPKEFGLPELEGAAEGVRMRIAPNPSGPLHLGHSRMAILNDEYVGRYGGVCICRFEDTDPARVDASAYDSIPEDLGWLGVAIHETVVQSDRFEDYYSVARQLLGAGHAYVCTCKPGDWRELKGSKKPCPHREAATSEQLSMFDKMFDGTFGQEEAALVVKTDLQHPNPALRDFAALRIDDTPHPRTGSRYRVYPLMNLSVAVDDHALSLTHVLRGKDHLNNTYRQEYIFDYMGWSKPKYVHYGRVSIQDAQLSTSRMAAGIADGRYSGWDDPQLGTLAALRRRGVMPEAIRRYWVEAGLKEVDIEFSWKTLYSFNKDIIDDSAGRYFFVDDPVGFLLLDFPDMTARAPLHPAHADRGSRDIRVSSGSSLYLSGSDVSRGERRLRLKDLCNVVVEGDALRYDGNDLAVLKEGVQIDHWAPQDAVPAEVLMPDGGVRKGLAEHGLSSAEGTVVQLERFGYARVEQTSPAIRCVFTHR
ncbi:MAG: glutamate--tRNA ligase [Methanobacteriota archaeon]|nr:MAG: glutamate--tRNA ligase [Euryarchaeota archaeon]